MNVRALKWAPPRFVEGAGVFAAQLLAVVAATWPLGRLLATHAPGNLGDPLLNAYLLGWGGHAIVRDPLDVFGATMFDPERLTLAYTENLLGLSLPFAPLLWLTDNALLVLNVALLTAAALAGLGAYLLVRELTGWRPGAFVCGVAYTVMPARLAQIEHFHVFTVYALPFVLLFLVRLGSDEHDRKVVLRRIAGLAVAVAAGTWASLTGAVLIGLVVAGWAVWALLQRPLRRRALVRGSLGVGLGLLLSVPVLLPYLVVRSEHPGYRHPEGVARTFSASPGSYLSPPAGGVVVRGLYDELRERFGQEEGAWEKRLFPGFWLTTVAVVGLVLAVRRREGFRGVPLLGVLVAVMGFVFSLGPRWSGDEDGVPLPFLLLSSVVNLTRVPSRLGIVVPLGLVLLAGWTLAQLPPRWRLQLAALSLAVLVLELAPTYVGYVRAPELTAAHRRVAERDGVVLALPTVEFGTGGPIGETIPRESQHLFLATGHYRRMINGYGAYHPPSFWEVVAAVQEFPSPAALEVFKRRDVRTVVVQTDMLPGTKWADVVERMEHSPGFRRVATGEGVVVYDVTAAADTAPA